MESLILVVADAVGENLRAHMRSTEICLSCPVLTVVVVADLH